jgi:hypothetical protein
LLKGGEGTVAGTENVPYSVDVNISNHNERIS